MSIDEWGSIDDVNSESGVSEGTKEGAEQAAEQSRRRSQALQALQKQEGKAKKQEASLIHILVQFLQSGQHRDLTNIIVKLLEQNIPVQIILGILSLIFRELHPIITGELEVTRTTVLHLTGPTQEDVSRALATASDVREFHAESLPEQAKKDLNLWIQDIIASSLSNKEIILERAYVGGQVNSTLIRLMMVILERYIATHSIRGHHDRMGEFCSFALQGIMKQLQQRQG